MAYLTLLDSIWLNFVLSMTVKLGVGGFSMGAATSLYSALCFALGKYNNGNPYPANISAAVGLSGWVPCSKFAFIIWSSSLISTLCTVFLLVMYRMCIFISWLLACSRTLNSMLEGKDEAARRAASLPILLCHGKGTQNVSYYLLWVGCILYFLFAYFG